MAAVSRTNYPSLASLVPLVLLVILMGLNGAFVHAQSNTTLSDLAAPCLACHSLDPDGETHVGPSLAGIADRPLGADRSYTYSEAFTNMVADDLIWNRQTLDRFLTNPQAMVEGTAMSYPGVPDPGHRELLLDWLFSDPSGKVADLVDANYNRDPAVREVLAIAGDVEYGEYLAGECLTCHLMDDTSGRVPPIHKLTPDYFVYALLEYQNGARGNRVMQTISGALGSEELAALTAVFSQQNSDN